MGKKRNNTAKKKKASKKAFGVSVLKGGTIARNNGVINKNTLEDGQRTQLKNKNKSSSNSASSTAAPNQQPIHQLSGNQPSSNNEHDEFLRSHASLEERQLALQARQREIQKKKRGLKNQKKGWGKFAHPSTKVEFASATLDLGPKSTEQLVNEAADHVALGMTDIGQSAARNQYIEAQVANGQSSLAAAAGMNWKIQVSNLNKQSRPEQNNPFAALDDDSDSDNEWSENKSESAPQFNFQPASFSFQPTQVATQNNDYVDPDL